MRTIDLSNNMELQPLEPHPLDYDWRFAEQTVQMLVDRLQPFTNIFAVGVPSLASQLDHSRRSVYLIDRQPLQTVVNHSTIDPGNAPLLDRSFDVAILDPPWYPEIYHRWIAWSAAHLRPGSELLASVWTDETRRGGAKEREELIAWLSPWADVRLDSAKLHYETPLFEIESSKACNLLVPVTNWRTGDLLQIRPFREPPLLGPVSNSERWIRFVFDDYQLALRLGHDDTRPARLSSVPGSCGWKWPSVSRRAPGRQLIDLWSSRNEVALAEGSLNVLDELRSIVGTAGSVLRKPESDVLRTLAQWEIPRGPYWRTCEWMHRA